MDDFVYSVNGQAAFWISRDYWHPYPPEDTVHNPVPDDAGRDLRRGFGHPHAGRRQRLPAAVPLHRQHRDFAAVGIDAAFVQDNHVRNPLKGTLRGLHYQMPPAAQGKLMRVTRGAIFDIAVDIRRGSPSFGRHAAAVLTADNWERSSPVAGCHRKNSPTGSGLRGQWQCLGDPAVGTSGFVDDSPLEGDGFELPVPREKSRYPIGARLILL
jgi:hypothetical protein